MKRRGGDLKTQNILYRYCLCLMAPQLSQSHECQVTTMEQVTFYCDWESINMRVYKMSREARMILVKVVLSRS